MPVTLAVSIRDHKRPPPLPSSADTETSSAAPPPLPSMRVPKGAIAHAERLEEIDVHAAVLRARRATEELEWQAQVKRAKDALDTSEAAEWAALRARMTAVVVDTAPPRRPQPKKPAKPTLLLASVPKALETKAPDNGAAKAQKVSPAPVAGRADLALEREAEEREWQQLRARAQLAEEREWEQLIARARAMQAPSLPRRARPRGAVVAWP
jgi:hypothetical protein